MARPQAIEISSDEEEDEDLRIAIALSLGQDPGKRTGGRLGGRGGDRVIDLTQDDDEEKKGEEEDKVDGGGGGGGDVVHDGRSLPTPQDLTAPVQQLASASNFTSIGLDRKRMEEERLARLSKRKASQLDDDQASARPIQRPRTTPASSVPPTAAFPEKEKPTAPEATLPGATTPARTRLPFPHGVVKKTWAFGQPRQGDDIKIEEVLQKRQLLLAVLSSFQWDYDWLESKIDLGRTRLILIAFAADAAEQKELRAEVPGDRIRFCFPPMQQIGAMHSKLMLLKYEKYLRIAVPTGNFVRYDWGETGTMENMVFVIDLPRFETAKEREAQKLTAFAEELFYFLHAQGLDGKLVDSLRNYNFAETGRYGFVHTIPGTHTAEEAWRRSGYCGLGRMVNVLGLGSSAPIELDFVCASLGAVNYSLVTALYHACQGDSGLKEYELRIRSSKGKGPTSAEEALSMVNRHMRVFFPSRQTVLESKGGRNGAGTICFQSRWWQSPTFPHELLRDCKSVRKGLLMHSKLMYVRPRDAPGSLATSAARCFAYVGSANLSESAWGRLVRDRSSGKPRLTCRNWECGVLVPVDCSPAQVPSSIHDGAAPASGVSPCEQGRRDPETDLTTLFRGRVPVPMEWPGRVFRSPVEKVRDRGGDEEGEEGTAVVPWFFQE
ncbi:phospholipase D/nuclease [Parathielavia appendiculata]|uniref:Phospholipase D/nuclease n=1 Tax=Parathielavia appendiculata TaxID=2587402 RepID=A0AAN6Z3A2_9PEZI|nr:phospholipase D/nuclease [Parathielavia appendiculata]